MDKKMTASENVNVILINYPVYAIYEIKKASDVDPAPMCKTWCEGQTYFCLSFPAIGESSRNGATYLQSRGI